MNRLSRTRLAVLGTISDLHRRPITYDLACVRALVTGLAPDLLCAEVTREAWEARDLTAVGLEVREALIPIVATTDIVLVPVAPTLQQFTDFMPAPGWRHDLVRGLGHLLRKGQLRAARPEAINGVWFGAFCHAICALTELAWMASDQARWKAQNRALAENIVQAVQRDPGCRVLVVVQCQRLYRLIPLLRHHADTFEIVNYQDL